MINAIGIQTLCINLSFDVFKSLIKTIRGLIRRSYNSNRNEERQNEKNDININYKKQATGSKYDYKKQKEKDDRMSVNRALHDIKDTIEDHQAQFSEQINLRDEWRSFDLRTDKFGFLANKHLARAWKIQTRLREKKILTKFKNNADRITTMTFSAHRHNLSFRALEAFRHSVCFNNNTNNINNNFNNINNNINLYRMLVFDLQILMQMVMIYQEDGNRQDLKTVMIQIEV